MKTTKWIAQLIMSMFILINGFSQELFAQSPTGREVMKLVDDNPKGDDRRMRSKMTLISKNGGERIRSVVTYSKDYGKDAKAIFYFEQPADVRGTGFLTWTYDDPKKDDDRWLYLPALKSSRRISGSSKNDYFMGSDLTYDDMGGRSLDEDKHTFLREEKIAGEDCWVVESVPKEKGSMYSKRISYVQKKSHIVAKIEFYDSRGSLLKILSNSKIAKVQGFWIAQKTEVENIQRKHKTVLEFSEIKFNLGLSDSLFRVSTLERGRIR